MDANSIIEFDINPIGDNSISETLSTDQRLACFDYDWTLIKPKNGRTFPKDKDYWMWLRPNVPDIIKTLSKSYNIVIFTNQTKLWKLDMIKESLGTLDIYIKVIIGFGKGDSIIRKPNPLLFFNTIKAASKRSFYVGDAAGRSSDWSDSDLQFAKNINMRFKNPEEVFPIELTKTLDSINYHRECQEVIILVGYPSSGKSTWAKNKLVPAGYIIISGDVLKTLPKMLKEAKIHLNNKKSVVFDATNPKRENRAKIIELASQYNISTRCINFKITIEEAMEWNTLRLNETGKKVPKIAFYLFRKNYEPPTNDECEIIEI